MMNDTNVIEIKWKILIAILLLSLIAHIYDSHIEYRRNDIINSFRNNEAACYKYLLDMQKGNIDAAKESNELEFIEGYLQRTIDINGILCLLWENLNHNIITGNHYYCMTINQDLDWSDYFSTNRVTIELVAKLKYTYLYSIGVTWD